MLGKHEKLGETRKLREHWGITPLSWSVKHLRVFQEATE